MWIWAWSEIAITAWPSIVRLEEAGFLRGMAVVSTTKALLDGGPEIGRQPEVQPADGDRPRQVFDRGKDRVEPFRPLADERDAGGDVGNGLSRAQALAVQSARLNEAEHPG